jgi:hypothetical protein
MLDSTGDDELVRAVMMMSSLAIIEMRMMIKLI